MDIHFYLNNQEVNVETGLTFTETLDESLDGGTVTLEYNNSRNAILPMTPFQIKDLDTNETLNFVVVLDSVEKVSKTQEIYSHTLTVTQNTHELSKHILRNSQFYNPHKPIINIPCNFVSGLFSKVTVEYEQERAVSIEYIDKLQLPYKDVYPLSNKIYKSEKIGIPTRARISKAYIEVDTSIAAAGWSDSQGGISDIPADHYTSNQHKRLCVDVVRYENGILADTLELTAVNGATTIAIDEIEFFANTTSDTKFQLMLSENRDSTFEEPTYLEDVEYAFPGTDMYVANTIALINLNLKVEIFYHTLYDILDEIRKQTRKSHKRISENNYRDSIEEIYQMPSKESEQGKLLDSIIAPDFSFTQKDVYSCVNDIFAYIDAIATLDENKVLGFEYFNDLNKKIVQNADLQKSDIQTIHNDEYYTNKIQAQYQDGRQENAIYYPAKNGYRRIGTKSYGVLHPEDYIFTLPYPIDYIDKVLLGSEDLGIAFEGQIFFNNVYDLGNNPYFFSFGGDGGSFGVYVPRGKLDITPAVVEQDIYQQLELEESSKENTQLNSLYYIQGEKSIQVGGTVTRKDGVEVEVWKRVIDNAIKYLLGETTTDLSTGPIYNVRFTYGDLQNLKYQIKYHAKYDGKVDIESSKNKAEGETYTAQGNSGVQISRMGTNMLGLVARLGNEQKVVSLPIASFNSRIKKGMIWIDEEGNKYIANKIKTTVMSSPEKCITEVEFSKDFNMLSQFIQVDKQKRFYEISDNITSKGYETLTEYLYFDFETLVDFMQPTCISASITGGLLMQTFKVSNINFTIDFVEFSSYENEEDTEQATEWIYAPIHIYGCGNCVCFETGYDSPLNAGDRVVEEESVIKGKSTLYTAESGIAEIVRLKLAGVDKSKSFEVEFPILPHEDDVIVATDIEMKYYKRPSEIFHLNYEIALLPKDNKEIYFGENLIVKNALVHDYDELAEDKVFNLYTSKDERYSIIDKKALGEIAVSNVVVSVTQTTSSGAIYGRIIVNEYVTCNSWCIADQDGNIYIAANQELNGERPTLHFATRNDRIL